MSTEIVTTEERLAALELEQKRSSAFNEIQNVMGRYALYHTANMHRETYELFALKTPGVRAEMMWGVYEGAESLERLYPGFHHWTDGDAKGKVHMHTLTSPLIEVAADATTAKAVWICPGLETMSFTPGGSNEANWAWMKYGCDFVLEDGEWKIWHLHVYGIFLTPYEKSWVETAVSAELPPPIIPEEYLPDRPPTSGWNYHPDAIYPKDEPTPPVPYAEFDEATAF